MAIEISKGCVPYSEVVTHISHMESTEVPGVDFSKADIKTLYIDLEISGKVIATIIGSSSKTPYQRLRSQGIEINPTHSDPLAQARTLEGLKNAWQEKRRLILDKVQTKEANEKRSSTMKRIWAENPSLRETVLLNLRPYKKDNFGDREKKVQRLSKELREGYISKAQGILESPRFHLLTPLQQEVLEFRYVLDGGPPRKQKEAVAHFGKISRDRIGRIEKSALKILFSPNDASGIRIS